MQKKKKIHWVASIKKIIIITQKTVQSTMAQKTQKKFNIMTGRPLRLDKLEGLHLLAS